MADSKFKASEFQTNAKGKGWIARLIAPPVETEWFELEKELFNRRLLFHRCRTKLSEWSGDNTNVEEGQSDRLAATDLFVEKAQSHLTRRAIYYYRTAYFFIFVLVIWLIVTAAILWRLDPAVYIFAFLFEPTWQAFLVWMMRSATVAGILLAGIYLIVSLIRAFLHEATVLLHRRHALRFGRLFIYLKFSGDESEVNNRINGMSVNDLEEAFGWNIQPSSAFKDIDPGKMSTSLQKHMLDMIGKVLHIELRPGQEAKPEGKTDPPGKPS